MGERRRWLRRLLAGLLVILAGLLLLWPAAHQRLFATFASATTGTAQRAWLERLDPRYACSREALAAVAIGESELRDGAFDRLYKGEGRLLLEEVRVLCDQPERDVSRRQRAALALPEEELAALLRGELASADEERRRMAVILTSLKGEARLAPLLRARLAEEPLPWLRAQLGEVILELEGAEALPIASELALSLTGEERMTLFNALFRILKESPQRLPEPAIAACTEVVTRPFSGTWKLDVRAAWILLGFGAPERIPELAARADRESLQLLAVALDDDSWRRRAPARGEVLVSVRSVIIARGGAFVRARFALARLREGLHDELDREELRAALRGFDRDAELLASLAAELVERGALPWKEVRAGLRGWIEAHPEEGWTLEALDERFEDEDRSASDAEEAHERR